MNCCWYLQVSKEKKKKRMMGKIARNDRKNKKMRTKKTRLLLLAMVCLAGIALAIAQPAPVVISGNDSNQTVQLIAWYPLKENITDIEGAARTFNVTINQPVTASWLINGTEVSNQTGVNFSEYVASAAAGYWNVTAYVYNENGSAMRTWCWTVSSTDTTPPAVISHAPTGTKESVKTYVTATFNEIMNPSTLSTATIIVKNSSDITVIGNVSYDSETNTTVTFNPLSELEYNETYTVTITEGVQDLAGNSLCSDFCWNFTTRSEILKAPIVISGYVIYTEGAPSNVSVNITNLNTSEYFLVKTANNSNYYRMHTDSTHLHAGDILRINATDGWSYNETVLTAKDIESGGFRQNLTLVSNMPDLIISDWSSEWVSTENGPYNITYTVKNVGDEKADKSTTTVFIAGIEVIEDSVPALASSANYTSTVGPLPFNSTPRNISLVIEVCADSDNAVEERNEINNCLNKEFPINLRIPVCDMDWVDEANGRFNITYLIANSYYSYPGGAYAAASNTTINITNIMINGSVSNITTIKDPVPALPPHARPSAGECYKSTLLFTCVANTTVVIAGVCADGDNEISESNEADNCCRYEVSLVCPAYKWAPDLKIVNHSVTWVDFENKTFNVNYTVANIGNEIAGASTTHIAGVDSTDHVEPLAPGKSVTHTVGPFTLSGLETEFTICADSNDVIIESNEENNCCNGSIGIAGLNIYIKEGSWINALNKTYNVKFTVCNSGSAASGACKVYAYIDGSDNATATCDIASIPSQQQCIPRSIGPFTMTGDNDTIKLCIEWEDGAKHSCTDPTWPISVFRYGGCLAVDDSGKLFACGGRVDRSCKLIGDMYCDLEHTGKYRGTHGLAIGASDIIIDGNSSAIVGDRSKCVGSEWDSCQFTGINNHGGFKFDNVTIKNLEVSNFCNGILIRHGTNHSIENCSIHDNGPGGDTNKYTYGITVENSSYTTIDNCSVYNNTGIHPEGNVAGGHGINFDDGSDYCRVTNSNVFHNYISGILASPTCKYLYIGNNLVEDNGYCNESKFCAGVNLDEKGGYHLTNSTVENNVILNNTGPGIYVAQQGYTTIKGNTVKGCKNGTNVTGNGIFVDDGRVTFLYNNTCCESEGSDIFNGGFATFGDDNTCDTTSNYNDEGTRGCIFYCGGVNGVCVGATKNFRCGDIVTESCTFNRSISCRGRAEDGLIVGADGITIDGAGYTLTGNFKGTGVFSNYTNVRIKNMQVKDFSTGTRIENTRENTIENFTVRKSHIIGIKFSADNGTVRNSRIYDTNGTGIFVGGNYNFFENNTMARNKGYGIYFSSGTANNTIIANAIGDNEDTDIHNANGSALSNNSDNNTCDTAYRFRDIGMVDYNCRYPWTTPDLIIPYKKENPNPEGIWVNKDAKTYNIKYTIENTGASNSRPAGPSTTNLSIDRREIDTGDRVGSLKPGDSQTRTFRNYTAKMPGQSDRIKVCADGDGEVRENNDANKFYCNDIGCYTVEELFEDKEANNCREETFSADDEVGGSDLPIPDENAACISKKGTAYRCDDPVLNTIEESCTFNGSMGCPPGCGLIIGKGGIRIEGNGHALIGDTAPADCVDAGETYPCEVSGIYNSGHNTVTITNLRVAGFCTGITLKGSSGKPVKRNTIENCDIYSNGFDTPYDGSEMITHGIHMVRVQDSTIKYNEIHHNHGTGSGCDGGGNGIFFYAGDATYVNNEITRNKLYGNDKAGFWTKYKPHRVEITDNVVWGNGYGQGVTDPQRGGIVLRCEESNENLIERNRVYDNDGDGIYIGGRKNTLSDNEITRNTEDGIDMSRSGGSYDNRLDNNTVCENEGCDILTLGVEYGNTGDDNFCDRTEHYSDDNCTDGCAHLCIDRLKPDLIITEKSEVWVNQAERTCTLTYTVKNIGNVNASASSTYVYIDDVPYSEYEAPELGSGDDDKTVCTLTMPDGKDSVWIDVCADYGEVKIDESNEDNNCLKNGFPSKLTTINVTPSSVTLYVGDTQQFTATAYDQNGATLEDIVFSWSSSYPSVGTVSDTGLFTAKTVGPRTTITASSAGVNGTASVTVKLELLDEPPEGPGGSGSGGGGGGGVRGGKGNIFGDDPGSGAGIKEEIGGEGTKELPINDTKAMSGKERTGKGYPFGKGGMIETVKVVAPPFFIVSVITIAVVLFYMGYRKEKRIHKR